MKHIFTLFILAYSNFLLACPYCAGSDDASDRYTYIILGVFILLTYIPLSLLFRMAKRHGENNAP